MSDLVTMELVSLYQSIDLDMYIEAIPHISIKVVRWLKGCVPALLGHQNESEQTVTPVRSQTSRITVTKLCVSGQGFLLEQ